MHAFLFLYIYSINNRIMKNLLPIHKKLFIHPVYTLIIIAVIIWGLLAYIKVIDFIYSIGIRVGEALAG